MGTETWSDTKSVKPHIKIGKPFTSLNDFFTCGGGWAAFKRIVTIQVEKGIAKNNKGKAQSDIATEYNYRGSRAHLCSKE